MEGVGFAQLSEDEDNGGADAFPSSVPCLLVGNTDGSGAAPSTHVMLGCAAGPVAEDCVPGLRGLVWTPQPL